MRGSTNMRKFFSVNLNECSIEFVVGTAEARLFDCLGEVILVDGREFSLLTT
jgi:hypothetical protein